VPPHQQRVIDEKSELDEKLLKLRSFLTSSFFQTLPDDERGRLELQEVHMSGYSEVLRDRIESFT
jgi:hypothetical protein